MIGHETVRVPDIAEEFNRLVREKNILRRAIVKALECDGRGEGLPILALKSAMENTGGLREI